MKKKELIIVVLFVLIGSISIFLYRSHVSKMNKNIVQIVYNEKVIYEFNPLEDNRFVFEGAYGHMEVEVKDGKWRVTNEECPNHICSDVGWVSLEDYLPIICVPNKVYVVVKDNA